jgi:hypothetical protein
MVPASHAVKIIAAVVLAAALAGCRTQAPALTTREVAELSAESGAVSAALIEDPNAPAVELGPGEEFLRAQLDGDNPAPVYPRELIARAVAPHRIVVRILFDERGRVLDAGPSPLEPSTLSGYTARFDASVCAALLTWRVYPPAVRKFRPGPDSDADGKPDYRILVDQKPLKSFFDVAFTFEIVNGEPVVRQGAGGARVGH